MLPSRHTLPVLLTAALLCAAPVLASGELEAARAQAQQTRQEASALRARQQQLRAELTQISEEVATLKANARGKVVRGGRLQEALQRSQSLSDTLSSLARQLAEVDARHQANSQQWLGRLNERLVQLRSQWTGSLDKSRRQELLTQMRQLKQEREQVRAGLSVTEVKTLTSSDASDNPEDLLEQADALRDAEDKLRERLKQLEGQLADAREEREFDRRMNEFLGDENLFDDSDRRLRLQRPAGSLAAGSEAARDFSTPPPQVTDTPTGPGATLAPPPPPPTSPSATTGAMPSEGSLSAKDGLPQFDSRIRSLPKGLTGVPALEAEKKRLQTLADELKSRADALEGKAKTLR